MISGAQEDGAPAPMGDVQAQHLSVELLRALHIPYSDIGVAKLHGLYHGLFLLSCYAPTASHMAATRKASCVCDSRTSTISAGVSPMIPRAMIQFSSSWSPEAWISSGVSAASWLPAPRRSNSR